MPSSKPISASEIERRQNVARVILDHVATNGMTVNELAKKAKIANSALYNITKCKRGIGPRIAQKLIKADVSRNDLLLAAEFAMDGDKQDVTVLLISKKISRLPKDKREFIEGIVDGLLEAARKKK